MPAIVGTFPYGETATVSSAGRERKERFLPGAFARSADSRLEYRLEGVGATLFKRLDALRRDAAAALGQGDPIPAAVRRELELVRGELEPFRQMPDVTLLRGHNFDQPLAARSMGSLVLRDTPDALLFRALVPADRFQPRYMEDTARMIGAGLLSGISPGFRPPPAATSPNAERIVQDAGETVQTREILDAVLYELSAVTRPTYKGSTLDEVRARFACHVEMIDLDDLELRDEDLLDVTLPALSERFGRRNAGIKLCQDGGRFEDDLWL